MNYTKPLPTDCPFCAQAWGLPITGHTPCRRHARILSETPLGAILIETLQEIGSQPVHIKEVEETAA